MGLTGFFAGLFGCAKPLTYEDVVAGDVTLDDADREVMDRLLASGDVQPAEVLLLPPDEDHGAEPYLKIENGRITRLALAGLAHLDGVGRLEFLRELRLSGAFESLELSGLGHLERLFVLSRDGALRNLELSELPSLSSLSIHGADLPHDLDLRGLPLRSLTLNDCGLETLPRVDPAEVTDLFLVRNDLRSLAFLHGFEKLERLHLSSSGLESLDGMPPLPSLRALYLSGNPLRPDVSLDAASFPKLSKLDLSRTGLRAAPLGLRDREGLRLQFEPGVAEALDFEATLERLRQAQRHAPGELVEKVRSTSGTIRGSSGRCTWKTGMHRRAEVSCRFTYDSVRGTALVRLGETDPAMPFRGGGAPRVKATLTVGEGEAALYVKKEHDLVATAQLLTEASDEIAEAARRPGDAFEGYRRVVALPGEPATVQGGVLLLGSRVALIVEAVDADDLRVEARDVTLVVEPV